MAEMGDKEISAHLSMRFVRKIIAGMMECDFICRLTNKTPTTASKNTYSIGIST
jgi:hypothetical protein